MPYSSRREFVRGAAGATLPLAAAALPGAPVPSEPDRAYWIATLTRIADPVLLALSARKLKATMPVEAPHSKAANRAEYTHLEALGRLLCGLSPWLESGDSEESALRNRYAELARHSIAAAVDPSSPDYLNFSKGSQPLVDAAFLALAVLRAPTELWGKLDGDTRQKLIDALRSSRVIRPSASNWLLFSATVEAFLCHAGEPWDEMRVDYAVRQLEQWYKGDGFYGDGPNFHCDYYNSFVIHPLLLAVLDSVSERSKAWDGFRAGILERSKRYAAIEERLIAPDGSYPVVGRSIAYRCGAFHLLATIALRRQLPAGLPPEQVRAALSAVIRRTIDAPGTFDAHGWLTVGLCGHQPSLGENYISTGSLYLCAAGFLPLGLPAADPFWGAAPQPWTSKRAWSGQDLHADHAL
jgi:hypothetical protein